VFFLQNSSLFQTLQISWFAKCATLLPLFYNILTSPPSFKSSFWHENQDAKKNNNFPSHQEIQRSKKSLWHMLSLLISPRFHNSFFSVWILWCPMLLKNGSMFILRSCPFRRRTLISYYKPFLILQPKNCRLFSLKHSALHTWVTWCWTTTGSEFQTHWRMFQMKYCSIWRQKNNPTCALHTSSSNIILFNTWEWKDGPERIEHTRWNGLNSTLFNPKSIFVFSSHNWFLFFFFLMGWLF